MSVADARARAALAWTQGGGSRGCLIQYGLTLQDVAETLERTGTVNKIRDAADEQQLMARLVGVMAFGIVLGAELQREQT